MWLMWAGLALGQEIAPPKMLSSVFTWTDAPFEGSSSLHLVGSRKPYAEVSVDSDRPASLDGGGLARLDARGAGSSRESK